MFSILNKLGARPPTYLDREVRGGGRTTTQTLTVFQLLQVAQTAGNALGALLVVRVECQ